MFGRHTAPSAPEPEWRPATDPEIPSRSCCCPARPVVRIIMPPAPGRDHPVDLYLCGHHFRASRTALLVAGGQAENLTTPLDTDIEILAEVS